jgi:hypothetical protein
MFARELSRPLRGVISVRSAAATTKLIHLDHAVSPRWWHGGGVNTSLVREKLTLRLPSEIHRKLKAVAVENGRSLNAEIVQRLRRSFAGTSTPKGSEHHV